MAHNRERPLGPLPPSQRVEREKGKSKAMKAAIDAEDCRGATHSSRSRRHMLRHLLRHLSAEVVLLDT